MPNDSSDQLKERLPIGLATEGKLGDANLLSASSLMRQRGETARHINVPKARCSSKRITGHNSSQRRVGSASSRPFVQPIVF
jgi:hypothetical protein